MTEPKQTFVIAGASLAGAKAAETLREEGFDGRVVLVGSDPERPYERPPLSKGYLVGKTERDEAYVHPEDFYERQQVELMTSTTVARIDPGERRVTLGDGGELRYDRLLIATGATPRHLDLDGSALDGIHYLRTLADCDALRAALGESERLAVVGAGWIGSEIAASARQLGLDVTLVEPLSVPLERVLGAEVGAIFAEVHRDHGVELLTGVGVEGFEGDGRVTGVRLADDRVVACDLAVVGVGVVPNVALAEDAGLDVENGIAVDAGLATSGPGIYAAGDVASAWHPFYGRRVRVEHWANALNQGPAAARAMLGQDVSYDRIPYFFSDQYDVGIEYSGLTSGGERVVFRGDPASRELVAFWLDGERRVTAGMNLNVWDVNADVQDLIRSRAPVDLDALRDPGTPLGELVGG